MSQLTQNRAAGTGDRISARPLVECIVVVGLMAASLGLVDFVLFETHGQRPELRELILSKPSFWSLSFLSYQVVSLIVLAISLYLVTTFLLNILLKRIRFLRFIPLITLSYCFIFSLISVLRFLKNPYQRNSFTIFIFLFLISVILLFIYEIRYIKNSTSQEDQYLNRNMVTTSVVLIGLLSLPFLAPDISSWVSRLSTPGESRGSGLPNVLIIVLDTVRADHLSCYGYQATRTPNIDRIANSGLVFLNAFSAAPWTVPSHASMFTGLYPSRHHTDWSHPRLEPEHLTLAEHLQGLGYRTAGFSENPFLGANHGLEQGYAEFFESWKRPMIARAVKKICTTSGLLKDPHEHAPRTSGLFRRWISDGIKSDQPFFAYINFMAAHLPRYPRSTAIESEWSAEALRRIEPVNLVPERFYLEQYRLDEDDLSVMREIYDQEIEYIDQYVGEVAETLETFGILDDTLLIVTSDHGENFGDHGFIEHQLCLYNSLIHVPLIIRYPQEFSREIISRNVSTAGLFLTILDIIDLENSTTSIPDFELMIPSILRTPEDQTIIAEHANALKMMKQTIYREARDHDFSPYDRELKSLTIRNYKYIWDSNGREELYDIEADPFEENNVAAYEPVMIEGFRQILMESTNVGTDRPQFEKVLPVDAATRDALRALGYEH